MDRAARIESLAKGLLRFSASHQRWVRFSTLRVFCGTAVSTTLSVVPARFHLRSLCNAMGYRHARSGDCRLGNQVVADLRWWSSLTSSGLTLARPSWPAGPTMLMETDASRLGWGAVLNSSAPARGHHSPDRADLLINLLELGAIRLALLSFRALLPPSGVIIRLKCDSMVALGVLQAQSSPSAAMMAEYRLLHAVLVDLNVELRHEYVASALNVWADRLSREVDSTDWSWAPAAFRRLDDQYGPHTVDLFATEVNTRCVRFDSKDLTPGALGANALLFTWAGENAWANPPFNLMGPVLDKVIREEATATVVAPVWRAQPWWTRAVEACSTWEMLPPAEGVYPAAPSPGSKPTASPFWRTAVFRFPGAPASATTRTGGRGSSSA